MLFLLTFGLRLQFVSAVISFVFSFLNSLIFHPSLLLACSFSLSLVPLCFIPPHQSLPSSLLRFPRHLNFASNHFSFYFIIFSIGKHI